MNQSERMGDRHWWIYREGQPEQCLKCRVHRTRENQGERCEGAKRRHASDATNMLPHLQSVLYAGAEPV